MVLAPQWSKQSAIDELDEYASYPPLRALLDAHGIDRASFLWARQAVTARAMHFRSTAGFATAAGASSADSPLLVVAPGVDLFLLIGSSNGGGGGGSEPSATDGTAHHASGGGIFLEPSPSSSSISKPASWFALSSPTPRETRCGWIVAWGSLTAGGC